MTEPKMTESSLAAIGALDSSEGYQSLLTILESKLAAEVEQLLDARETADILAKHSLAAALRVVISQIRFCVTRYAQEYSASKFPDPVGT